MPWETLWASFGLISFRSPSFPLQTAAGRFGKSRTVLSLPAPSAWLAVLCFLHCPGPFSLPRADLPNAAAAAQRYHRKQQRKLPLFCTQIKQCLCPGGLRNQRCEMKGESPVTISLPVGAPLSLPACSRAALPLGKEQSYVHTEISLHTCT